MKKTESPDWDELFADYFESAVLARAKGEPKGKKKRKSGTDWALQVLSGDISFLQGEVKSVYQSAMEKRTDRKVGDTNRASVVKNAKKMQKAAEKTIMDAVRRKEIVLPARKWDKKEIDFLKENKGKKASFIALELKRTAMSIYRKVYSLKKKGK